MNQIHENTYVKRIAVDMYGKSFDDLIDEAKLEVLEKLEFMMLFQNT